MLKRHYGNRNHLFAFVVAVSSLVIPVHSPTSFSWAAEVIDSSFCIKAADDQCVAFPNHLSVAMSKLPFNKHGKRVLHFRSVQQVEKGRRIFHVWVRNGKCYVSDPPKKFIRSNAVGGERILTIADAKSLGDMAFLVAGKKGPGRRQGVRMAWKFFQGLLVVDIGFSFSRTMSAEIEYHVGEAVTHRKVHCAGMFRAAVTDTDNQFLPGRNSIKTITIIP